MRGGESQTHGEDAPPAEAEIDGADETRSSRSSWREPMKLKIRLDDPKTRAVWEAAKRAKAEVEGWPRWKRGEDAVVAEEKSTRGPDMPSGAGSAGETLDE